MKRIIQVFIVPDSKLRRKVYNILKAFSDKYKVYKAFNDWKGPHITIFTMESDYSNINNIISQVKDKIKNTKPFKVYIKDIGYFMKADSTGKRNYVIFLKIKKTRQLQNLWKILNKNFSRYKVSFPKYVPHMTITRQDLDKENFYKALNEYKDFKFSGNFKVKEVKVSTRGKDIRKIILNNVKLK